MALRKNLLLLLISVAVALIIQVVLESSGRADSLGWWYTAYSALIYTLPIFVVAKIGLYWWQRVSSGIKRAKLE